MKNNTAQKNIPQGWFETAIEKECDVLRGQGLSRGKLFDGGKNECILYGELYTTYSEVVSVIKSHTDSEEGIRSKAGDILIPASTTTIAKDLAIATALNKDGILLGGDINILRKKKNSYNANFLAYYLTHYKNKELSELAQGITIIHLYGKDFKKLNICIPKNIEEQQKIAEILGTVDKDITKTQEVIEATEKLKRGLMQQLFTRGIGHTKFKKTKLGEIPEEWEFGGFESFVDPKDKHAIKPGPFGSALKKEFYVENGFKIYGQEQVIKGDARYGDYYVNEKKYKELKSFKVSAGDILVSLVGTIGKILIIPDNFEEGIINPRLLKITPDKKRADSKFIAHLLKSDFLIQQMNQKSHGGTMNILNKGMLLSVTFGVPGIEEQQKIAEILSAVDEKISINKKLKEKLTLLKKGLMQDLLSGKVRV